MSGERGIVPVDLNEESDLEVSEIKKNMPAPKNFSLKFHGTAQVEKKKSWFSNLFSKKPKDESPFKKGGNVIRTEQKIENRPEVFKKTDVAQKPQAKVDLPQRNFQEPAKRPLPRPGLVSRNNPLPVARYTPVNYNSGHNSGDSISKWIIILILILITILIVGAALVGIFWEQLFGGY